MRSNPVQIASEDCLTTATVTGANALKVDGSAVTQPVSDAGGSLTVDGTVAVSNFPAVQPVNDNGGSLTVDGTVTANAGTGAFTPYAPPALASSSVQGPATIAVTNTSANTVVAAPGVGLSIYVTDLMITNSGADSNLSLKEGSGGTTRIQIFTGKTAANGVMPLNIPWKLPANTALVAQASNNANIFVNVQFFVAA